MFQLSDFIINFISSIEENSKNITLKNSKFSLMKLFFIFISFTVLLSSKSALATCSLFPNGNHCFKGIINQGSEIRIENPSENFHDNCYVGDNMRISLSDPELPIRSESDDQINYLLPYEVVYISLILRDGVSNASCSGTLVFESFDKEIRQAFEFNEGLMVKWSYNVQGSRPGN